MQVAAVTPTGFDPSRFGTLSPANFGLLLGYLTRIGEMLARLTTIYFEAW